MNELKAQPIELLTVPRIKKAPLWFRAFVVNDDIYVEKARLNRPSSEMNIPRKISARILSLYILIMMMGE